MAVELEFDGERYRKVPWKPPPSPPEPPGWRMVMEIDRIFRDEQLARERETKEKNQR